MSAPVAAIDCGSNSTRLLVGEPGRDVERLAVVTGLARSAGPDGTLARDALDRTLEVLAAHRRRCEDLGVAAIAAVATQAVRRAPNRVELLGPAAEVLGVEVEVIDGHEEARRSFRGAVEGLGLTAGPTLVVDIGGASTEFAVGDPGDGPDATVTVASTDMGSVTLTERFVEHDPPAPEELSAMLSVIGVHLDEVVDEAVAGVDRVVAVAGTATTVAAVEIGLATWDRQQVHGFELSRAAAEDVFRTLATESLADRRHNPGLAAERADVIVAGAAILVGVLRRLDRDGATVADSDLLDATLAALWSTSGGGGGGRGGRRPFGGPER